MLLSTDCSIFYCRFLNDKERMEPFEANTEVFIVRIWLEPRAHEADQPEWRGVIEHAPTRQRRYFRDLASIGEFITPYLQQLGITVSSGGGWRSWFKRQRSGQR